MQNHPFCNTEDMFDHVPSFIFIILRAIQSHIHISLINLIVSIQSINESQIFSSSSHLYKFDQTTQMDVTWNPFS